jgi:hypothetical protein
MGEPLFAITEQLNREQFAAFVEHMQGVLDRLDDAIAAYLPVADTIRDESDRVYVKAIADQAEQIRAIVLGVRNLSSGDADQVAQLGQLLDRVEEINLDIARSGGVHAT